MPTTEGEQQGLAPEDAESLEDVAAKTSSRLHTAELEDLVDAVLSERLPREPPEPDPYIGRVIDRRYVIESLIAAGGMGLVYRCRHSVLGKRLAIKIIRGDVAQMPDGTDRFLLEAKAASAIGHEHIVDIADFGALPDGSPYLVMEYLDGISLAALLRNEPDLGIPRIARIATQIAEGLGAAHAAGIVHRDLKPDNVFVLDRKGEDFIKILDFGVARMAHNAKKLTQAGTIVGTPHYMSPEQALGLEVDHRGDIYALGVILYELCAGRVPFDGSHYVAVLNQHLHALPPSFSSLEPPVHIPGALERIVGQCLAKSPADRFETMAQVSAALAVFRGSEHALILAPGSAAPDSAPTDPPEPGGDAAPSDLTADRGEGSAAGTTDIPARERGPLGGAPASNGAVHASGTESLRAARAAQPVPTDLLPVPEPTLVLRSLSGTFTVRQKRLVSGFSLLVLLAVCVAAAVRLGSSRGPAAPAPAPAIPAVLPEPGRVAAPLPTPRMVEPAPRMMEPAPRMVEPAPRTAEPAPAEPPHAPPASPPRLPTTPDRSSTRPSTPTPDAPSASDNDSASEKDLGKKDRERERRAPATAAPKRDATHTTPAGKPRPKGDFMDPWPSPR
jgi:serine/threonine protein kinase